MSSKLDLLRVKRMPKSPRFSYGDREYSPRKFEYQATVEATPKQDACIAKTAQQSESAPGLNSYNDISASGKARQHNGNIYNYHSNTYTLRQRRSDEILRESTRNKELLKAATDGQTQRVESLIRFGADVDFVDDDGCIALHHAALSGFEDTVQTLLEQGADVNASSTIYGTPICLAAAKGREHVFENLLQRRAKVDESVGGFGSLLHAACLGENLLIMRQFLELDVSFNLARHIQRNLIAEFSVQRSQPNDEYYWPTGAATPLHLAAYCGYDDVVKFLIENKCRVNTTCTLSHAKWTAVNDASALMLAALQGHTGILRCLLEADSDPNQVDADNTPAIIYAAMTGNIECGKVLVEHGASIMQRDHYGRTALYFASCGGHTKFLEYLIDQGADVEDRNHRGNTILMTLIKERPDNFAVMEVLIERGCNLKALDCENKTAFQIAMDRSHNEVVQILKRAIRDRDIVLHE